MLNPQQPVAEVVLNHSECALVFKRHHIDFCCRGDLSIEAAARAKKVDVESLLAELARAIRERGGDPQQADLRGLGTPALIAYITSRHHQYLRQALPFVRALASKVSRVHGTHNPRLAELSVAVDELAETLLAHLDGEEQELFPALSAPAPDRQTLSRELAQMSEEHLGVSKLLERVRAASEDFALPEWACNSYRTLFSELEQLEGDVFTHVHLENHVLKPRFTGGIRS